ncbi:nucleoporin [Pyrenophora seminiperda CCB06]|uniref:Nucleoporin n=1 Tax=Pyrenophora seminiperda CCB06 TaxID=1302712 RepID=A0A3M7M3Q3_9PLEO|nr:nucleoporin [Pyrenophora seminiperda CCB06]
MFYFVVLAWPVPQLCRAFWDHGDDCLRAPPARRPPQLNPPKQRTITSHVIRMAQTGGTCLYKEARLNIDSAFPGSTIAFNVPASSPFGGRPSVKRSVITEHHVDKDENAFTRRHLATDGSMHFRRHHGYPRSFLWRVLDNRKMLEIQTVDLDHDFTDKFEANLTILFQFPAPIRPFCVAFAEPADRDALTVFAITTANELYTITLHRDFFINPAASELDPDGWFKRFEPALFSGRIPYRLVAVDAEELLVTLDDGAICRLDWDKANSTWDGSRYQESTWYQNLWKAQPTVRFENAEFATSAAAAVAISPDRKHILSVCLNHSLRAWNIASGKSGAHIDLLGAGDPAVEKSRASYTIGTSQSMLMAVVEVFGGVGGADYHVVTYSPKQHQFKFWGVIDADNQLGGFYDAAQGSELIPPIDELMNTTVWTLEEFYIIPGPTGWRGSEIWIRARSGPSSKVYSLKFDLTDLPDARTQAWKNDWVSVDSGSLTVEALKANPANPSEREMDTDQSELDSTEQWLDFLFYPGRFTVATLETSLVIYKRGLERVRTSRSVHRGSLKERICATVTAFAANGNHEPADLEDAVAAQWQSYYSLVKDLHKRRGESLSLAYDRATDRPWLVLSDHLSAIRNCSELEVTTLNAALISGSRTLSKPLRKTLDTSESRDVARLLNAAASFRQRLPFFVQHQVQRHMEMDLLQSRNITILDRMEWIEANSELSQHVSDEDVTQLVEELGMEVKDIGTETFLRAIQKLGYEEEGKPQSRKQIARYGLSALSRISQETLEADQNTLLDLLALLLFMFIELEGEMPDDFDASEVFAELFVRYKDGMTVSWLARTVWSYPSATGLASENANRTLSETLKIGKKLPLTQTVLEGAYGGRAFEVPLPKDMKANLFTRWSRGWLASIFDHSDYESVVEDIMSILLCSMEYELALDFSRFLTDGYWATYLKGRLYIALGEHALASACFQKPAYYLSLGTMFDVAEQDTIGLVSEVERNSFSDGLAHYYSHVIGLFERAKAYSYVADFAKLGLRSLLGQEDETLKTELLQRLFTASIQTSRFHDAYSALVRHTSILYDRLQRLKSTSSKHHDPADESLAQCYLMIINTLSSVSKEDAYILAEQRMDAAGAPPQWGIGQGKKLLKRQIITLDTLRKEYQAELDRVAAIESGQFPFVDPMDDNSKSLRRLAADHGSLHTAGLPPNYLFPPESDASADLTSLDILLAGPVGTPYAGGVWQLHLDIPPTYPTAPPTAQFRTRLWHPNIDEETGAVCVETLKRDWSSTLKLRDVLVTISCLLIQPNPASALNEAAGKLAVEDWDGYCRRAKLMTGIHAAVPVSLAEDVREAQMRGEDKTVEPEQPVAKPHSKGKEKERVKVTPAGPKLQRMASEDEENRRRRGTTQDADSDPESDWIPGPVKANKAAATRQDNIFGIKGLEDAMQIDTPPKRIFAAPQPSDAKDNMDMDDSDPFITVSPKRTTQPSRSFDLRLPQAPTSLGPISTPASTDTPSHLKLSHQNPFAPLQASNDSHPLLREFSYSWEEAAALYGVGLEDGTGTDSAGGLSKAEARKRVAGSAFEERRVWEMKRFKRAGCDLRRWDRGDFGPKMGVGRL